MPENDRPTVWIMHNGGHDYSDAAKHGTPKFVLPEHVTPFQVNDIARHCKEAIVTATENDFICMAGSPAFIAIFIGIWTEEFGANLNLLVFHAKKREYLFREYRSNGDIETIGQHS